MGTGYLIYGTQELFGYPARDDRVDFATGMWGIWMSGFMQFIAGIYLFAGLTLFGTFKTPALYMAALAFLWRALVRARVEPAARHRPACHVGMTIAFLLISILGVIVFFKVGDAPVGGVFIGLVCVYAADFFASLKPDLPKLGGVAERVLGFFRLGTRFWLMYLVFAVALNFVLKYTLPL